MLAFRVSSVLRLSTVSRVSRVSSDSRNFGIHACIGIQDISLISGFPGFHVFRGFQGFHGHTCFPLPFWSSISAMNLKVC